MNLKRIALIHDSQEAPISTHLLNGMHLQSFIINLSNFQNKYFQNVDSKIENLLKCLFIIRIEIMNSPIPYDLNKNLNEQISIYTQLCADLTNLMDAEDSVALNTLANFLKALPSFDNPVSLSIENIVDENVDEEITIVVRSRRIRDLSEEHFRSLSLNYRVITPGEVQVQESPSLIIYCGAPEQFNNIERQISAVISTRIFFLCFQSRIKALDGLLGPSAITNYSRQIEMMKPKNESLALEFIDFAPEQYTQEILQQALHQDLTSSNLTSSDDKVECFAYALAEGYVVYIPIPGALSQNVSVEVYVPTEPKGKRVQRQNILEIDAASIFLVRQGSTATEALRPIADQIMGQKAQTFRRIQMEWKSSLSKTLQKHGVEKVTKDLRELGIDNPYPTFWANPLRMRPKSDRNFEILIEYLDMSTRKKEVFEAANAIGGAHIKAGHAFLNALQDAFEEVEPTEIYREEILVRELSGTGSIAKLAAMVCLGKLPGIYEIPEEQTRKPIQTSVRN